MSSILKDVKKEILKRIDSEKITLESIDFVNCRRGGKTTLLLWTINELLKRGYKIEKTT